MSELAKKEIELFKKKQDMYGQMCADSAFRAFMSMAKDSHSGFSWDVTSGILIRLLYDLPLTPITDEDFLDQEGLFQESPDSLRKSGLKSSLECNRLCSVFRNETLDGKVSYTDVDRVMCYDEENPAPPATVSAPPCRLCPALATARGRRCRVPLRYAPTRRRLQVRSGL